VKCHPRQRLVKLKPGFCYHPDHAPLLQIHSANSQLAGVIPGEILKNIEYAVKTKAAASSGG